jgi:hypothetical protein
MQYNKYREPALNFTAEKEINEFAQRLCVNSASPVLCGEKYNLKRISQKPIIFEP